MNAAAAAEAAVAAAKGSSHLMQGRQNSSEAYPPIF